MRYICSVCGYVYDDAARKVPFSELPHDWKCPVCGSPKSAFRPETESERSSKSVGRSRVE